jgi:predicted lipoprotein with Yx(FWY)xxD motif
MSARMPRVLVTSVKTSTALIAAGLMVAACSSSGSGSSNNNAAGGNGGGKAGSSTGSAVTVEAHSGPMGTYLTDAAGKTLYEFGSDTKTKSSCSGACTTYWPALTTKGTPKAANGAKSTLLGTINVNGTKQVTYAGHPLYYFALDTAAGDRKGQGTNQFGAKWWILAASGQPITSAAGHSSAPSNSASSKSGGGGGGWA